MDYFRPTTPYTGTDVPAAPEKPVKTSETVDNIIDFTLTLLETGSDAVGAAPVPGLTVAVSTLILILEKLKVSRLPQK